MKRRSVDESTAEIKARVLVSKVKPKTIPVSVDAYVNYVGAVLRHQADLGQDEPGWSFENAGKEYICVNANDSAERQRFTICHELGHIVLRLRSDHKALPWWSYVKRPPEEICCDVFAAELLLPINLFKPLAEQQTISFAAVDELAAKFEASRTATGSRFVAAIRTPCAFVLSEKGKIRYATRSGSLRDANAWIQPRICLPKGSVSERVRAGAECGGPEQIDADEWFSAWERGGVLQEEARHLERWDQTLSLLWFENDKIPPAMDGSSEEEGEDELLKELEGILPWPNRKCRR